ncbi:hypothetical protein D3C81_2027220 [compost metagenome]
MQTLMANAFIAGVDGAQPFLGGAARQHPRCHQQCEAHHLVVSVTSSFSSMAKVIGMRTAPATGLPFFSAGR